MLPLGQQHVGLAVLVLAERDRASRRRCPGRARGRACRRRRGGWPGGRRRSSRRRGRRPRGPGSPCPGTTKPPVIEQLPSLVGVLEHRRDRRRPGGGPSPSRYGLGALVAAPPEVGAVDLVGGEVVDLLPLRSGRRRRSRGCRRCRTPTATGCARRETTISRSPVGRVDAEHLAQRRVRVLGPVLGVVAGAAVAEAEPELAVGAEGDVAAVVVRVGLVDGEHDRAGCDASTVVAVHGVGHHPGVAVGGRCS